MAKSVFHTNEVVRNNDRLLLYLSRTYDADAAEAGAAAEAGGAAEAPYSGPTADDLRKEAEDFKAQWEAEKTRMREEAEACAADIIKQAEETAFQEVKRQTDEAQALKTDAEAEAAAALQTAKVEAERLTKEAAEKAESIKKDAYEEGRKAGEEAGYQEGNKEAARLIERIHTVLERIMDKRQAILEETEQQIIDLVLLMTRKVVKAITESQRDVVIANVAAALKKLKGRGDVTIRVNLADAQIAAEHIQEFIDSMESARHITVAEDSSVGEGGCIVETDLGGIDARIASQLSELEQKIIELSPLKSTGGKNAGSGAGGGGGAG